MENFTPIASLIGGLLIGLSAAALLLFNGKIAGVSGIVAGLLRPTQNDTLWRGAFIGGLVACEALHCHFAFHKARRKSPRTGAECEPYSRSAG